MMRRAGCSPPHWGVRGVLDTFWCLTIRTKELITKRCVCVEGRGVYARHGTCVEGRGHLMVLVLAFYLV